MLASRSCPAADARPISAMLLFDVNAVITGDAIDALEIVPIRR
jgi:hypothetical protein